MSFSLPSNGQTNWGTPLNNYISEVVLAQANLAETTISSHQSASDPHGDRAYALSLVSPITSHVNQANGYVVLNSSGTVPNSLLPSAGGLSDVYDVSSSAYGGNGVPGVDNTTPIQNALNACANAGGGEVWIPNGIWTISSTLVIGNNTWLHLSPGAKMIRGVNPSTGIRPGVMLANFNTSTPLSSMTGNIIVSGGIWDATNGNTVSTTISTIMQFANISFLEVSETQFINQQYSLDIQLFGVQSSLIAMNKFLTYKPTAAVTGVGPVRLSAATTAELGGGFNATMYTNAACNGVAIDKCIIPLPIGGLGTGNLGSYWTLACTPVNNSVNHSNVSLTNNVVYYTNSTYPIFYQWPTWDNVIVTGNIFNGAGNAIQNSGGITGVGTNAIFDNLKWGNNIGMEVDCQTWQNLPLVNGWGNQAGSWQLSKYRLRLDARTIEVTGVINIHATVSSRAFSTLAYSFPGDQTFNVQTSNSTVFGNYFGSTSGTQLLISGGTIAANSTYMFNGSLGIDI